MQNCHCPELLRHHRRSASTRTSRPRRRHRVHQRTRAVRHAWLPIHAPPGRREGGERRRRGPGETNLEDRRAAAPLDGHAAAALLSTGVRPRRSSRRACGGADLDGRGAAENVDVRRLLSTRWRSSARRRGSGFVEEKGEGRGRGEGEAALALI